MKCYCTLVAFGWVDEINEKKKNALQASRTSINFVCVVALVIANLSLRSNRLQLLGISRSDWIYVLFQRNSLSVFSLVFEGIHSKLELLIIKFFFSASLRVWWIRSVRELYLFLVVLFFFLSLGFTLFTQKRRTIYKREKMTAMTKAMTATTAKTKKTQDRNEKKIKVKRIYVCFVPQ